jgi:hypothetical protein
MAIKVILFSSIILFTSCFDFSPSKFKNIGDGFQYGYFNGSFDLLDIYHNDAGIFHQMKCTQAEWNQSYIFVNCETLKEHQNLYYIIDKLKYNSNPLQLGSIGVLGPLNYDSLIQTDFYRKNHSNLEVLSESWFH